MRVLTVLTSKRPVLTNEMRVLTVLTSKRPVYLLAEEEDALLLKRGLDLS